MILKIVMKKRRIFHRKQYKNPFYPNQRGRAIAPKKDFKIRLPKFIYIVIVIAGLFIFSYANIFQIDDVEVSGMERISSAEIESLILNQADKRIYILFKQGSIFFFSKREARKTIQDNFLVEKVKIKKSYFKTIKVDITEKQSGIAWVSNGDQHYLGLEGVALREIELGGGFVVEEGGANTDVIRSELSSGDFPVVYDLSNGDVLIGQLITTEELVNFVLGLFDELSLVADFEISHFNIERPFSREVNLVTKEGWEARFKIDEDPSTQGGILMQILQQKIRDRENLEYIDLRFGEKVFYK